MNAQHARPLRLGAIHALLVAPVAIAAMATFGLSHPSIGVFLQCLAVATPVTTLAVLLLGLPGALILRRCGVLNWLALCMGGACIGAAIASLAAGMLVSDYTPSASAWRLLGMLTGAVAAIAFSVGIRPRRVWGRTSAAGV